MTEKNELTKEKIINERAKSIKEMGSVVTTGDGMTLHLISIIGQVEGHMVLPETQKTTKYEHILPSLVAIEQSADADGVLVLINTVGGDVEAGLAIAELIAGMSKPTVSIVIGGGHSIGIPIAVSCDVSFIAPSATMTVHPVRTSGTVLGVPQSLYCLERMQERINDFIVRHSHVTNEKLSSLMMNTGELTTDIGSIVDGEQAVSCGLIDNIGGLHDALRALKMLILERRTSNDESEKRV